MSKTLVGIIGGCAAAAIAGTIYYLLTREDEAETQSQPEVIIKPSVKLPDEFTMEQMEDEIECFSKSLDGNEREEFLNLYDKLQTDAFIPWVEDRREIFRLNYIGVCLGFTLHMMNRINRGEYHKEFDDYIAETFKIYANLMDELTIKFSILRIRDLKSTGLEVFYRIVEPRYDLRLNEDTNRGGDNASSIIHSIRNQSGDNLAAHG